MKIDREEVRASIIIGCIIFAFIAMLLDMLDQYAAFPARLSPGASTPLAIQLDSPAEYVSRDMRGQLTSTIDVEQ